MKMKKWLALALCMAFLIGPWDTAMAEGTRYAHFAIGEDVLWKVSADAVLREPLSGGEAQEFALSEKNVLSAAARADELYLLAGDAGEQHVAVLDGQGAQTASYPIPSDWRAHGIAASEYGVYLLATPDGVEYPLTDLPIYASIYVLDEQHGGEFQLLEIPGWENAGVDGFSVEGQFLSVSAASALLVYDLANAEMLVKPTICDAAYNEVAMGPIVDRAVNLYVTSENRLNLFNAKTHEFSYVMELPQDHAGIARHGAMLYSMDRETGEMVQVMATADADSGDADKLVIVNCYGYDSPRMYAAIDKFHETYPDVEVRFRQEGDSRVIAAGVMSGAPGFDILTTQEYDYNAASQMLYHSGALVDLSQYEEITRWIPEYYEIYDMVSLDGHLFAIPEWVSPDMWLFNAPLAEELGIEKPELGWTWADFFEMAETVNQYNATAEEPVYMLADEKMMPYLINQYKSTAVDFSTMTAEYDSEMFVHLLEQWKQICDQGLVKDNESMWETGIEPEDALFCYIIGGFSYSNIMDEKWVAPPVVDADHPLFVRVSSFKINANSSHIDWAVHFLACFMDPECFRAEDIGTLGRILQDKSYYHPASLEYFALDEESEALWKYLLENSVMDLHLGELDGDIRFTLYPQFISGEITAAEFAKGCQTRASMVLGE